MSSTDAEAIEAHEHRAWESAAGVYADAVGPVTALSGQLELCVEFGGIDRSSTVLDIGCGPNEFPDVVLVSCGHA